jgi:tRNA threonylcarbamoyladenosine biosynthesis protein TsaE
MNAAGITLCEAHTQALGRRIGELSVAGDVFLFCGELGAGKTCLIRGIATGLGVTEHAFSPSFVLIREYRGRLTLFHMDFYRLEQPGEVADLGVEDYLEGEGVCAIEWAERAAGLLPEQHLLVELMYIPGAIDQRRVRLTAEGRRYVFLLHELLDSTGGVVAWS